MTCMTCMSHGSRIWMLGGCFLNLFHLYPKKEGVWNPPLRCLCWTTVYIQPITNEPNTDGLEKVTIDTLTGIVLAIWVEHVFRIKLGILIGVRYSNCNWCCFFVKQPVANTIPILHPPSLLKNREISWGCECLQWPSLSCNALGCTQHGC